MEHRIRDRPQLPRRDAHARLHDQRPGFDLRGKDLNEGKRPNRAYGDEQDEERAVETNPVEQELIVIHVEG